MQSVIQLSGKCDNVKVLDVSELYMRPQETVLCEHLSVYFSSIEAFSLQMTACYRCLSL